MTGLAEDSTLADRAAGEQVGAASPAVRSGYREQVRERALQVAEGLTLAHGWDGVRVGEVAALTGVSRPTLYAEFGNKDGLGEALVLHGTERFLAGVTRVLAEHARDVPAGVEAAVRFTLVTAAADPMLHAVLTQTRAGSDSLLPLLTTRSAPVLAAATAALTGWFAAHAPHLDATDVEEGVDALVRLTVSHLVLPAADPERTARLLAGLALRYLRAL